MIILHTCLLILVVRWLLQKKKFSYLEMSTNIEDLFETASIDWVELSIKQRTKMRKKIIRRICHYKKLLPVYEKHKYWHQTCSYYALNELMSLIGSEMLIYHPDIDDIYEHVMNTLNEYYPPYAAITAKKLLRHSKKQTLPQSSTTSAV